MATDSPTPPSVLCSSEAAKLLGISKTRINQIASVGGLPEPAGYLGKHRRRLWRTEDIVEWATARGRSLHWDDLNDYLA